MYQIFCQVAKYDVSNNIKKLQKILSAQNKNLVKTYRQKNEKKKDIEKTKLKT